MTDTHVIQVRVLISAQKGKELGWFSTRLLIGEFMGSNPIFPAISRRRIVAIAGDCKSPLFGVQRFESSRRHKQKNWKYFFNPKGNIIFVLLIRDIRSLIYWQKCRGGQGVKTPPFHGGITGSNPVRGTSRLIGKGLGTPNSWGASKFFKSE